VQGKRGPALIPHLYRQKKRLTGYKEGERKLLPQVKSEKGVRKTVHHRGEVRGKLKPEVAVLKEVGNNRLGKGNKKKHQKQVVREKKQNKTTQQTTR